jgi:hypothetical protein
MTVAAPSNCPLTAYNSRGKLVTCDCEAIRARSPTAASVVDDLKAAFETTELRDFGCFLHFRFHRFPDSAVQIEVFLIHPESGTVQTRYAKSLVFDETDNNLDEHVERAARRAQESLQSYQRGPAASFAMLNIN